MNKQRLQQLVIMFPILLIGTTFAYFKYLKSPLDARMMTLHTEMEKVKQEYIASQKRISRLPRLENEIFMLNKEIRTIEKKLPNKKDLPGLIRLLSKKLDTYQLSWTQIIPGEEISKQYYYEHIYRIPFSTSYHNLAEFLSSIGQLERIFTTRFNKLTMISGEDSVQVQGELALHIFTAKK